MCIIVDANAISDLDTQTEHGAHVLDWLFLGKGGLVVGGKLRAELGHSKKMRETMQALNQAGRLHSYGDAEVQAIATKIKAEKKCCSNDTHVIALAVISDCRLVFTKDRDLHKDLGNRDILNPAAAIYQNKDRHGHLLKECKRRKSN